MTTPETAAVIYHWILTAQDVVAVELVSLDGKVTAPPGATRSTLYQWVRAQVRETVGHDQFVTLFFALEPENVNGGAS